MNRKQVNDIRVQKEKGIHCFKNRISYSLYSDHTRRKVVATKHRSPQGGEWMNSKIYDLYSFYFVRMAYKKRQENCIHTRAQLTGGGIIINQRGWEVIFLVCVVNVQKMQFPIFFSFYSLTLSLYCSMKTFNLILIISFN